MSEKTSPDTVPGLGFKDKEKALETLKVLEGRDPDYQKLAIKGLIGRAKRTLTLTKAEDKLQNIKDAMDVFETWLQNYEKNNLAKENRPYLPLATLHVFKPLINKHKIQDQKAKDFLSAYESVNGDYKHLRTVSSGDDEPTWDIVRNKHLKKIFKSIEDDKPDMWKNDLPTEKHLELIMWAHSPDASKIKKNLSKIEELLESENENSSDDENHEETPKSSKSKRKSDSSRSSDDETPKKKNKK
ncbi:hypothetical protein FQR65_LT04955 [Abscondita terminalis]|nr:hypothetical protein FQR65_LT04955 [Abscondita terminalis]